MDLRKIKFTVTEKGFAPGETGRMTISGSAKGRFLDRKASCGALQIVAHSPFAASVFEVGKTYEIKEVKKRDA